MAPAFSSTRSRPCPLCSLVSADFLGVRADMIPNLGRASVTALALLAGPRATEIVLAQVVTAGSVPEQTMAQWAIEKGGAFAVILIILFFYRRDYVQLTDFWRAQSQVMKDLVEENTKAQ